MSEENRHEIPHLMFVTAVMGLEALDRGIMLSRMHTATRCLDIVSKVMGTKYKRSERNRAAKEGRGLIDGLNKSKSAQAAMQNAKKTGERLEIHVLR